ncbi:MAG TPA: hypothetical protein VFL29_01090 [Candidatus Dormibacteraeota bacterium]|nr:hypothetical protein [Candidatus Dormibacteraeota bacterium]
MSDLESAMPDRELPKNLQQQLSASLEDGSPLLAPLPSQARYATLRGAAPAPRWRLRALTVAAAVAGIVAVALAGPSQPRQWLVQSVNDITKQVGVPAGAASPSPSKGGQTTSGQDSSRESPEPSESPEANEPSQAGASPEPRESPEPTGSPESGEGPQPSPTSGSSEDGGSGGDHSPQPSPSSGD